MYTVLNNNWFDPTNVISSLSGSSDYKNTRIKTFIKALIVTFLIFTCFSTLAKPTKIMIYGDSISAGYGMTLPESWPNLLNETFKSEQKSITIINESISGETTGGGLARIENVLKRHQLTSNDWIIIELGGNDGLRGFPIKTIKQNLSGMIEAAQYKGINVALMQIKIPPNYGFRYTQLFESNYQQLSEQFKLPLMPFFMEQIASKPQYMQRDNLHPNIDAQVIIRDIMRPEIEKLLENK
ncbi:arylesterase [Psychrosphaera aquimarina]|uniref:Arylesterase n=1 Tax=Psychrosphaera aquimarina TaxID=2044854 RepID=A0ABU3R633_9GAMM|nr:MULTISPECIES: arylesterase [Psychrosphaera]MDU0114743.1 arylesterase [Psychrosphaera aquimarina]